MVVSWERAGRLHLSAFSLQSLESDVKEIYLDLIDPPEGLTAARSE
ncbi:hypothetical protein RRSWK_03684 [Rhodopirellula sp. SWK7]|nr:hypothetical protein RRSWK_03684 [Rhodopirellula sp. SWK7]